ncbi:hypothetical protein Hypma_001269 [Hypsizygus marmoreus]|uniref:Uncharacterized protein n=1 Tax=Hypsizygus marmoreus TaxID=39966 RepID=A0A369J7X8_HYPMA|nr:hypothetical protein Hypma_001269 [Hypsizygus marmoreus]
MNFSYSTNGQSTPRQFSRRNARGSGWHKKGYRDNGCMWINVRRGSYGHTRGGDVNEFSTIADFWRQTVRGIQMEDGFPIPQGWTFELSSNKRPIEPFDEPITSIFDGGETVYVKIVWGRFTTSTIMNASMISALGLGSTTFQAGATRSRPSSAVYFSPTTAHRPG